MLRTSRTLGPIALLRGIQPARAVSTAAVNKQGTVLDSILIANRGEIALYVGLYLNRRKESTNSSSRVGRTAAQHGIKVTTLYTNPDSKAQHALSSPYAFNLGDTSAYLDGDRIIEIAKREGCQGVHPGYGFVRTSPKRKKW